MTATDPWIRDPEELRDWLSRHASGPIAVDLEADSFHHYSERICLVQLSAGGEDRLVDPLGGVDLGVLADRLADRSVRKIFHGADYDLRLLDGDRGFRVRGLFDTMIAARLCGERRFGLAALLDEHFGVRLDKAHQRADWSRRPLPDAMIRYAIEDTRHLERLADTLERRLRETGRAAWAHEEFRRLEAVRATPREPDADRLHRVKGTRGLSPRDWTVLRVLVEWREGRARERDVPPFRVASDAALVALAREAPARPDELARVAGLARSSKRGAEAERILHTIRAGLDAPPMEPPRTQGGRMRRPDVDDARFRRLRALRDGVARDLDLEPSLICSRRVLEAVAERAERGERWAEVAELRGWQAELLEPAVVEVWGSPPAL